MFYQPPRLYYFLICAFFVEANRNSFGLSVECESELIGGAMVPLDEMGFTMAGICEYVYLFHYFEVVLP
jgi:NADH:ubiquinone oxidoreductase subunit H